MTSTRSLPGDHDPLRRWLHLTLCQHMLDVEKIFLKRQKIPKDELWYDKHPDIGSCFITALQHLLLDGVPSWEIVWDIQDWIEYSQKSHPEGVVARTLDTEYWPDLPWNALEVLVRNGGVRRPTRETKFSQSYANLISQYDSEDDSDLDSDSDVEARVQPDDDDDDNEDYYDEYPDTDDDYEVIGCNNCYACVSGGSHPCLEEHSYDVDPNDNSPINLRTR